MKVLIIAAGIAGSLGALAAPTAAFELSDNVSRNTGAVAPGLQYTVTGHDGATVTVVEGQPRWSSQRRIDDGLVPGGDNIGAIVNVRQRYRYD